MCVKRGRVMRRTGRHRHAWTPTAIYEATNGGTGAIAYMCPSCGASDLEMRHMLTPDDEDAAWRVVGQYSDWWSSPWARKGQR